MLLTSGHAYLFLNQLFLRIYHSLEYENKDVKSVVFKEVILLSHSNMVLEMRLDDKEKGLLTPEGEAHLERILRAESILARRDPTKHIPREFIGKEP